MTSRAEKNRKQKNKTVIKTHQPKTTAEVVPIRTGRPDEPIVRDGLTWLAKKNRVTHRQLTSALAYRQAYREPQPGAIRSHLDDTRGSGDAGHPPDLNAAFYDAQIRLKAYREQALSSHLEMISVMDAVVGNGLTLAEYCPDPRRVAQYEPILRIALDLMTQHLDRMPRRHTAA
jgi:hypothetical protein